MNAEIRLSQERQKYEAALANRDEIIRALQAQLQARAAVARDLRRAAVRCHNLVRGAVELAMHREQLQALARLLDEAAAALEPAAQDGA